MINRLRDWKARFDLSHTRVWYTVWGLVWPALAGLAAGLFVVLVVLR